MGNWATLIYLAKPKSGAPNYNNLTWFEPVSQSKICTWTTVNFKKHVTSMISKHEPTIGPRDTGQWIPCLEKCELNIRGCQISKMYAVN